ncbi:MAG: CPBP family intramembrane glutamic endopeptidase [Verrucomicrobiota bacterium]|jgi:membrane protease YdiL (CAAX protease family)
MLSAKAWRSEIVTLFCASQLVCFCLGVTMVSLLQQAGLTAFKSPDSFGAVLVGTLSFQGATWVLIYFFIRLHQVRWSEVFGLRKPRLPRAVLAALLTVLVVLPVAWWLKQASVLVLEKLGWSPEEEAAVMLLAGAKTWWTRVYLGLFTVVIAPVAEEFIFRGVLYPFVKQLGYPRFAWIGVNFVFALIHMDAAALVPLFVLALALTWLYERTDNLLAPITAHSLFNAANLVLLFFAQHYSVPSK